MKKKGTQKDRRTKKHREGLNRESEKKKVKRKGKTPNRVLVVGNSKPDTRDTRVHNLGFLGKFGESCSIRGVDPFPAWALPPITAGAGDVIKKMGDRDEEEVMCCL